LTGEPEPGPEGAALRCGMCGQFRTRASAHRCPAPGLVPLSAAAARVLDACRAAGGRPLIVGGSVRDALVAAQRGSILAPKDVDIEVYDAEPLLL
jgi:tRNA nucleotidyltransferase (CCA-adding enzyme)